MYLKKRVLSMVLALLLAGSAAPAQAAHGNACYVSTLRNGQYVTQTAGKTGTITVYVNGAAKTTISRLNQPWYATKDKTAVVRGYDNGGLVC